LAVISALGHFHFLFYVATYLSLANSLGM